MFQRVFVLPDSGTETFFLWGPRQAGKSTLLRQYYPDGYWIDLLKTEEYRRYVTQPECGVSNHTAKGYFEILEDTLLARRLPAWAYKQHRRKPVAK